MNSTKIKVTIIKNLAAYSTFPFRRLDQESRDLLQSAYSTFQAGITFDNLLKPLECFLQITNQSFCFRSLAALQICERVDQFVGALYSDSFITMSMKRRYETARALKLLLSAAEHMTLSLVPANFKILVSQESPYVQQCRAKFEMLVLVDEAVWLWRGWATTNQRGRMTQLPFHPIYEKLGREFVTQLHDLCDQYFRVRKAQRIVAINDLTSYIFSCSDVTARSFKSATFMTKFWREFFMFYLKKGHASGIAVSALLRNWNNEFVFFAKTYLIGSGFFSDSLATFPSSAEGSYSCPKKTHIKRNSKGYDVKTKLITHIPLHVSDQEAMEILFFQINEDINVTLSWARKSAASIWQRVQQRDAAAPNGIVRVVGATNKAAGGKWDIDSTNPSYFAGVYWILCKRVFV